MARPKKEPSQFPAECCGVCKYSHKDKDILECWGNPPCFSVSDIDELFFMRSAPVEELDHICHLFKPKEHS